MPREPINPESIKALDELLEWLRHHVEERRKLDERLRAEHKQAQTLGERKDE